MWDKGTALNEYEPVSVELLTQEKLTDLTPDTTYTFKVKAENVCGTGPLSNPFSTVMKKVPSQPENILTSTKKCNLHLTWDPPLSTGGYNVTEYKVEIETNITDVYAATENLNCSLTAGGNHMCDIPMKVL